MVSTLVFLLFLPSPRRYIDLLDSSEHMDVGLSPCFFFFLLYSLRCLQRLFPPKLSRPLLTRTDSTQPQDRDFLSTKRILSFFLTRRCTRGSAFPPQFPPHFWRALLSVHYPEEG